MSHKALSPQVFTALENDLVLRAKVATKMGCHMDTINRYIKDKSPKLLHTFALEAMSEHLGTDDLTIIIHPETHLHE